MKTILLLFSLNAIFVLSQNDLNKYSLKGKVKTFQSACYDAIVLNDSLIVKGEKKSNKRYYKIFECYFKFNEQGFITDEKKNLDSKKFIYNKKNQLIFEEFIDTIPENIRKFKYKYNLNSQLKKEVWYKNENQIYYKILYRYKKRKLVSEIEKDLKWKEKYIIKYSYDKNKNLIKIEELENDSLTGVSLFKNDSLGRIIQEEEFDSKNALVTKKVYEYNENGLVTKISKYRLSNCISSIVEYIFDENNNLIEENEVVNDFFILKKFDLMGNLILSVNEPYIGAVFKYIYTYDQNNNWIRKTEYYNGIPQEIEEREITYY
jgi:hypothetical protein